MLPMIATFEWVAVFVGVARYILVRYNALLVALRHALWRLFSLPIIYYKPGKHILQEFFIDILYKNVNIFVHVAQKTGEK